MNTPKLFSLLFILIFTFGYSQKRNDSIRITHRHYVLKKHFYQKYTSKDSIGFMIKDTDTLIQVFNYIPPKGKPVPYEYKDDTFLKYYKKIAFREIHKDSADTKPMKYWKTPINIFFASEIDKNVKKKVIPFLKAIDKHVDSLSITIVKNLEDSNYVIFSNEDYQYSDNIDKKNAGDYFIKWHNNNQIFKGFIRINTAKITSRSQQIIKIKALFIGSLGWFNLIDHLSCNSYFSNCYSDDKQMTDLDWELLKYHYSYGICKGTKRQTFEEQHKSAKENLKKYGNHSTFMFYHQ